MAKGKRKRAALRAFGMDVDDKDSKKAGSGGAEWQEMDTGEGGVQTPKSQGQTTKPQKREIPRRAALRKKKLTEKALAVKDKAITKVKKQTEKKQFASTYSALW
eukprot:jgi/Mesvir1/28156/Mv04718-RA.1